MPATSQEPADVFVTVYSTPAQIAPTTASDKSMRSETSSTSPAELKISRGCAATFARRSRLTRALMRATSSRALNGLVT